MAITAEMVKKLREKTGAGMMDCKKALSEVDGDVEKAIDLLRTKGQATSDKRATKAAKEGLIGSYVHKPGGKIGVMVEVNCETDFVARTAEYEEFVRDIAMHIAAANPFYVSRDDVPESVIEREKAIYRNQALESGKPEKVIDRIVSGKLERYFKEVCLLEQEFIKDTDRNVEAVLNDLIGKTGEKVLIRRFVRFQVGEDMED
jgi:elongation factor Ts